MERSTSAKLPRSNSSLTKTSRNSYSTLAIWAFILLVRCAVKSGNKTIRREDKLQFCRSRHHILPHKPPAVPQYLPRGTHPPGKHLQLLSPCLSNLYGSGVITTHSRVLSCIAYYLKLVPLTLNTEGNLESSSGCFRLLTIDHCVYHFVKQPYWTVKNDDSSHTVTGSFPSIPVMPVCGALRSTLLSRFFSGISAAASVLVTVLLLAVSCWPTCLLVARLTEVVAVTTGRSSLGLKPGSPRWSSLYLQRLTGEPVSPASLYGVPSRKVTARFSSLKSMISPLGQSDFRRVSEPVSML